MQHLLIRSFIVSVKVRIFPLNMGDIIIYFAWWWEKYLSQCNLLKHTCPWRDKFIVLWTLNRQAKNTFTGYPNMVIYIPDPLDRIKSNFINFRRKDSKRRFIRAFGHFHSIILRQDLRKNSFSGLNAQIWLFRSQVPKINKNQILLISKRRTLRDASNEPSTIFVAHF